TSSSKLRRRLRLARKILASHHTQPATALWRIPEVEVVLDNLRGQGRGLDLGCGDGTLAAVLLANTRGVLWFGLDLDSRDAVAAERSGLYERVTVASASDIPLADASFDLVFSNSALEHMLSLSRVVKEVARIVRPGGRFIFTVPTPEIHDNLLWARILRRLGLRSTASRYLAHLDQRLAHLNYLSQEDWAHELERAGLKVERSSPYLTRWELAYWELLANMTGGLAYILAAGRKTPREIQQAFGVDRISSRLLSRIAYWLLVPVIVLSTLGLRTSRFSALYLEARRVGPPDN
ncbi:MAG: methyltransferase domain-containing protein, partial [Acidobacteriota bacterium]|nr:methyltransferase domain-containing protein [Acidobacteriota bacterium]